MVVHLSLGSNVGDRALSLRACLDALSAEGGICVTRVSRFYETDPVGELNQSAFLNVAVEIETELAPLELLNAAQRIERSLGRTPSKRWGPRVIDIDLILWGGATMDSPELTLPHPRFRERNFVLQPLAEIAPDAVDPVTGKSVRELASGPAAQGAVSVLE